MKDNLKVGDFVLVEYRFSDDYIAKITRQTNTLLVIGERPRELKFRKSDLTGIGGNSHFSHQIRKATVNDYWRIKKRELVVDIKLSITKERLLKLDLGYLTDLQKKLKGGE